jgi:hypothetical protein
MKKIGKQEILAIHSRSIKNILNQQSILYWDKLKVRPLAYEERRIVAITEAVIAELELDVEIDYIKEETV